MGYEIRDGNGEYQTGKQLSKRYAIPEASTVLTCSGGESYVLLPPVSDFQQLSRIFLCLSYVTMRLYGVVWLNDRDEETIDTSCVTNLHNRICCNRVHVRSRDDAEGPQMLFIQGLLAAHP